MKELLDKQFTQFYRIFTDIVQDFDDKAWQEIGHKMTSPKLLSFHLLKSIKYYTKDGSEFITHDARPLKSDAQVGGEFFISRAEVLENLERQKGLTRKWIETMQFDSENQDFPWTGKNSLSVGVFLAQHSFYHLGELNCLLNESLMGDAQDHFAGNIY